MTYTYQGDINIKYGGIYYDLENAGDDYIPVVKITDLDSACGFDGAILIERGSIYIPAEPERRKQALQCCGWDNLPESEITFLMLADAFDAYHGIERDNYCGEIIIQPDIDGPMQFQGMKADKYASQSFHESGLSLREFIEREYL